MKKAYFILTFVLVTIGICSCGSRNESVAESGNEVVVKGFNFYVLGDWGRKGKHGQQEVADQMNIFVEKTNPSFVISTGDNFYENGVKNVDDPLWKKSFTSIYEGSILGVPWFPVLGNHDYRGNPQAQVDYSRINTTWNMPSRYYTISQKLNDTTSARFIFLDTNPFIQKYHKDGHRYDDLVKQDTSRQLQWLDSLLTNSDDKWKIVVGHHPVYSYGSRHSHSEEMIKFIKPRLEKYNIQLYLAGHDHDLQHLREESSQVDYVVSGAGSEIRPVKTGGLTQFAKAVSGFNIIELTADSMHVFFIDKNGNNLYTFSRAQQR